MRVIVLLDDVEQMTAIGSDLLQRRLDDVRVVAFNKPRDALAWMATAPRVDLVLTDYHMAEMDGLTFLTEARGLHPNATRAIITAYLDLATTAPELGARGIHALIRKPWEWSDFTRAVFELLALGPSERAAIELLGPMAYPEGAFAELAASRGARPAVATLPAARSQAAPSPRSTAATSVGTASPSGTGVVARAMPPAASTPPPHPTSTAQEPASGCAHCGRPEAAAVSPIPSTNDDEEARRLLAYLQTRPGVAARIRAAVEQAASAHAQAQRRAPPPSGRGG